MSNEINKLLKEVGNIKSDGDERPESPRLGANSIRIKKIRNVLSNLNYLLVTIGAMVGAIAIIIANSGELRNGILKIFEGDVSSRTASDCFRAKWFMPKIIPHYLISSIGGSDNFPYWLKMNANNECNKKLLLYVQFGPLSGAKPNIDKQYFSIQPNNGLIDTFNPNGLELIKTDLKNDQNIKMTFSVLERGLDVPVDNGVIDTVLVKPYTIAWDLEKPSSIGGEKGDPVDPSYVVASLTAWTQRPSKQVRDMAKKCRYTIQNNVRLTGEHALESCYNKLFHSDKQILIGDEYVDFPSRDRQKIEPLEKVLDDGWATSLEAALLFAAVFGNDAKGNDEKKLYMLVAPVDKKSKQKNIYIGWMSSGNRWSALDMYLANDLEFRENLRRSSSIFTSLLTNEIRLALEEKGAFLSQDDSIAALHFHGAAYKHKIRPLLKVRSN